MVQRHGPHLGLRQSLCLRQLLHLLDEAAALARSARVAQQLAAELAGPVVLAYREPEPGQQPEQQVPVWRQLQEPAVAAAPVRERAAAPKYSVRWNWHASRLRV